jgi:hypothetical protein
MGKTKVFDSVGEAKEAIKKAVKKGYNGVHAGINWGGRKKYYVTTIGSPKSGRKTSVTDKLKHVTDRIFKGK